MQSLSLLDLNRCVARLPSIVIEQLKQHPNNLYVGGGFLRETIAGNAPVDIDLFGSSKDQLGNVATFIELGRPGDISRARKHVTDNAITILRPPGLPIQFITRWVFNEPTEVVESFDFTVCQAILWFDGGVFKSLCADTFYQDLAARRLVYTSPVREEEAGGSMMRVIKFIKRGYVIQPSALGKVIARVAGGVKGFDAKSEADRGTIIASLLYEVDPLRVIDGMEMINDHGDAP